MSTKTDMKTLPPVRCTCGGTKFGTHGLLPSGAPRFRCLSCGTRDQSKFTFIVSVTKIPSAPKAEKALPIMTTTQAAPKATENTKKVAKPEKAKDSENTPVEKKVGKIGTMIEALKAGKNTKEDLYGILKDAFGEDEKMKSTISAQLVQARIGDAAGGILRKEKNPVDNKHYYWIDAKV